MEKPLPSKIAEKSLSQIIRERRATPNFSSEPVAPEDLREILQAGIDAPSGYNLQPWRFIVVRDAQQRKRLRVAAHDQEKVEQAPVMIVFCGDSRAAEDDSLNAVLNSAQQHGYSASDNLLREKIQNAFKQIPNVPAWLNRHVMIAFTHMMLMAEALGYDTAPMEGFVEEKVKALLKIPQAVHVVALLGIGRLRGDDKKFAGRLPAERLVFAEEWGKKIEI